MNPTIVLSSNFGMDICVMLPIYEQIREFMYCLEHCQTVVSVMCCNPKIDHARSRSCMEISVSFRNKSVFPPSRKKSGNDLAVSFEFCQISDIIAFATAWGLHLKRHLSYLWDKLVSHSLCRVCQAVDEEFCSWGISSCRQRNVECRRQFVLNPGRSVPSSFLDSACVLSCTH